MLMRGQKKFFLFILPFWVSFFCIPGCGKPSFPREEVINSVKQICHDEYHLDVQTRIVGENLGTYVVLESIFDRQQGLTKEASEHLGDILLGVSRVSLSTDAPICFYTVIAADKTIPGVEAVFVRYVDDLKRYYLGNISREDFFQRMMIDVRFNPATLAERTVLTFFSNLSKGNSRALLANYLKKSSDSTEFSLAFLRTILEIKLKENIHFEILEIKVRPLPSERALVYCKVRETYEPGKGYGVDDFTFPSGFIFQYLFVIGSSNYLPEIREIIPLDYKDEDNSYQKRPFPEEYKPFENVNKWGEKDFLLEDLTLPQFLAGQMAQRIVRKVKELEGDTKDKDAKKIVSEPSLDYKVDSVKGHYVRGEEEHSAPAPSFRIDFKISKLKTEEVIPKNLYDLSFKVIKDVIEKYHFDDFKEVRLSRASSKDIKIISKSQIR
ncbi:MAG: hypothetical protein HYS07_03530 [Chlamydiae bacterium]|nr:hypothetical protein [Chlamydiota bacterium]MBI3276760.1 hypothetical protein [Chlamydiota bacterium]